VVTPGRLMFNPPDSMRLGTTERIEVRITRSPADLDDELRTNLVGRGHPQLRDVATSVSMEVTLRGSAFEVDVLSKPQQVVTDSDISTWEFDVRAVKRGMQSLQLCVNLRLLVDGQPDEWRSVPVMERTIDVQVSAPALVGTFIADNWQWLAGTGLGLAGVITAWEKLIR